MGTIQSRQHTTRTYNMGTLGRVSTHLDSVAVRQVKPRGWADKVTVVSVKPRENQQFYTSQYSDSSNNYPQSSNPQTNPINYIQQADNYQLSVPNYNGYHQNPNMLQASYFPSITGMPPLIHHIHMTPSMNQTSQFPGFETRQGEQREPSLVKPEYTSLQEKIDINPEEVPVGENETIEHKKIAERSQNPREEYQTEEIKSKIQVSPQKPPVVDQKSTTTITTDIVKKATSGAFEQDPTDLEESLLKASEVAKQLNQKAS